MTPPRWVLDAAKVHSDAVVIWIECARGMRFWPPIFVVTGNDVIWATRNIADRQAYRAALKDILSVDLITGILWDKLYLELARDDFPVNKIRVARKYRSQTQLALFHLRQNII